MLWLQTFTPHTFYEPLGIKKNKREQTIYKIYFIKGGFDKKTKSEKNAICFAKRLIYKSYYVIISKN